VISADDLIVSGFTSSDGLQNATYSWEYRADLKGLTIQFCFAANGYASTTRELLYTPASLETEPLTEAIVVPTQSEVYEEEDGGEPDL